VDDLKRALREVRQLERSARDPVREIDSLILESYRHFALARLRRTLDAGRGGRTGEATRA
jgi:hypothetical protein